MNRTNAAYYLVTFLALTPALASAQTGRMPPPALPAAVSPRGPAEPLGPPGPTAGSGGSVLVNPAGSAAPISPPLPYPATGTDAAARVQELLAGAAALVAQGNLSKAMQSYNEALRIAPRYAEAYRQRALTLLRLGDRVRAQADYARFLELDPPSRARIHEEIQLFESSGYARIGETVGPPYGAVSLGPTTAPAGVASGVITGGSGQLLPAAQSDMDYTMAREAFLSTDYPGAYRWAQWANEAMPQARIHALMAQILFAQAAYRGAAAEARAAAAMGPLVDWATLYGYYNFAVPRYDRQFHALEQYVRLNPSSADARFLLGYEYLILGQADLGHAQLAIAVVLQPLDVVARNILARDGVEIVGGQPSLTKSMSHGGGVVITAKNAAVPAPTQPVAAPLTARQPQKEIKR